LGIYEIEKKIAQKINTLPKKSFYKMLFENPMPFNTHLQHSLVMFSEWPVFLLNPSGNLHRKQMLSSSMLTATLFTLHCYRIHVGLGIP